jgi:four helix bundle protein
MKFDLEDRIVKFAGDSILFTKTLPKTSEGIYFTDQLIRASSGAALNYGEAQGTNSKKDFAYKITVSLRELKECRVAYKIINYLNLGDDSERNRLLDESQQLCAIFNSIQIKSKN